MSNEHDHGDTSLELDNHLLRETLSPEGLVHIKPGTDPEITNRFLNQVLAMEEATKGPHAPVASRLPERIDLPDPDTLTDREIGIRLREFISLLSERGIEVGLVGKLPDRLTYQYLVTEALNEEIPLLVPEGARYNIDGCDGWCPGCFQLPYCEVGQELQPEWKELG